MGQALNANPLGERILETCQLAVLLLIVVESANRNWLWRCCEIDSSQEVLQCGIRNLKLP